MIEILGAHEGSEYKSAQKLKEKFLATWPELDENTQDQVTLFVGYRIHSQRVKEIDIVIVGDFAETKSVDCSSGRIKVSNWLN